MGIQGWTYLLVGLSFALYIGVALWARARSTADFFVASGDVPPVMNGMATAADWMSAASFISMAGLISFMGYDGSVYLMGWTGGYVLLALLVAPYLRKFDPIHRAGLHWGSLRVQGGAHCGRGMCHLYLVLLMSRARCVVSASFSRAFWMSRSKPAWSSGWRLCFSMPCWAA